jgi:hypothetical protein
MLNEKLVEHIIKYIKDQPSSVKFDTYRDQTTVHVTGNVGGEDRGIFRENKFHAEFRYDKSGKITDMNGIEFSFDPTPLMDAITEAISRNFVLKRKKTKLGV